MRRLAILALLGSSCNSSDDPVPIPQWDCEELGAAVVDIGGGTTDLAILVKRAVRYTSVLPVGGDHFTRDMAVGLRTPIEEAERAAA